MPNGEDAAGIGADVGTLIVLEAKRSISSSRGFLASACCTDDDCEVLGLFAKADADIEVSAIEAGSSMSKSRRFSAFCP